MHPLRNTICALILTVAILLPQHTFAHTSHIRADEHAQLLATIELLQQQINTLQALITAHQTQGSDTSPTEKSSPEYTFAEITFYDGPYNTIYIIQDHDELLLTTGTQGAYDTIIWRELIDVMGANFIETYIREFRTYDDTDAPHDGFVYRYGHEDWVFGLNLHIMTPLKSSTDYNLLHELIIHEFAHILFTEEYQWAEEAFADEFWSTRDHRHAEKIAAETNTDERWDRLSRYHTKYKDSFVSAYATSNYHEDVAETFTHFVLEDRQNTNDLIEEKIDFMYSIDGLSDIRNDIRDDIDI